MKAKALSPGRKQEEPLLTNILSVERQWRNDDDALGDYDDDADNGDDDRICLAWMGRQGG